MAGSPGLTIDMAAVDLMARSPKEILTLLGEVGRGEKGKLAMSLEVSDVHLGYNTRSDMVPQLLKQDT